MNCDCCDNKCDKKCTKYAKKDITNNQKWKYTLLTTVIFLIIVHPKTYIFVQSILGNIIKIASPKGCPTMMGLIVHAFVFTIILRYIMDLNI